MFIRNCLPSLLYRLNVPFFLILAWVVVFQLLRCIFFGYQYFSGNADTPTVLLQSAWHGLSMDLSMASYLMLLPTLLLSFTARKWLWYLRGMLYYSYFISLIVSLIVTADLEVFKAWHFRLDTTPLYFLEHPNEAFASASSSPLLLLLFILLILITLISLFQAKIIKHLLVSFEPSSPWLTPLLFLFITATLIIPIRGGLGLAPMNQSRVYYSSDNFANQLAVNATWNFFSSAVKGTGRKNNPFISMSPEVAHTRLNSLRPVSSGIVQIIEPKQKINVLLIIWESLTAKVVSSLGGLPGITPNFDSLTRQGVLFTNLYASGDRSPKGIVAILSGYPAQPTTSIISFPTKTASLSSLPRTLKEHGYQNSFYYGGETEFANIKSYLLQHGFDRIIDHNNFASSEKNSKWGAHDHIVFNRLLVDLNSQKTPFFTTLFTLSSHEPFEVPEKTAIPGQDIEHKFLNSLHYTDASLGNFIRQAQTKPWWRNTLIVIVADHGHPLPKTASDRSSEFRIPMLWLGGPVEQKGIKVDTLGSQTDLAATLLDQLGYDSTGFSWSNGLLRKGRIPYAFYSFNNGFGWVRPRGTLVYDNIGKREVESSGNLNPNDKETGKAYLQSLFGDYLKR
ncbi:LTA synthase family protein [Salmonirosea aquatica]|uniref:Sulfatase-like hydrolase/transferase n=1 Tax=Salmonirosea aquatica TaxID=2654236 RepID=A0A7C9FB84_9BACT|nr:sulfatase-like hydrolase/transferase [Cytophagaceae bacterium SJW1-29]